MVSMSIQLPLTQLDWFQVRLHGYMFRLELWSPSYQYITHKIKITILFVNPPKKLSQPLSSE